MAIYKGIIAGIGDKLSGANVITPQFDARVNKFIIGQNCIFDGLTLSGNTLSAGSCLAEGYRGELSNPITLDTTAYVYGVFKVNHDSNILDEFYIETSASANTTQNDILHTAGIYYLLLYRNGIVQLPKNYPAKAVYSDNTSHINDNGTLGNNVTCPTQSVNDNSTKVANTAYVHNQIVEEIGYETYSGSSDRGNYKVFKKANYCLLEIEARFVGNVYGVAFIVPEQFRPSTEQILYYRKRTSSPVTESTLLIRTNGEIYYSNLPDGNTADFTLKIGYTLN